MTGGRGLAGLFWGPGDVIAWVDGPRSYSYLPTSTSRARGPWARTVVPKCRYLGKLPPPCKKGKEKKTDSMGWTSLFLHHETIGLASYNLGICL